jgi:acetone carboxylase gamma subunit
MRVRITEYLDVDLERGMWCCNRCGVDIAPAERPYKVGCLLHERDPREIHPPIGDDPHYNWSFDPEWVRIVEFYCPGCGTLIETEYLPPGHPVTWDIQLDLEALRRKHLGDPA